jgi:hypothetical protein
MMTYVVSFYSNLRKPSAPYEGNVYLYERLDDEPPLPPTNAIRQNGPVENDIIRYAGAFASEAEAWAAVREWFPRHKRIGTGFRAHRK